MAKALLASVALIAATAALASAPVQSGHDLFQQALVKERAEGNLQEAIDLYDRIVRHFPDDHALAAKALVQMGQCYEKLGNVEARKAYERVVRDYADQAGPLQMAQARLAALSPRPRSGMTVRRIWSDRLADSGGEISPDGRYLSFVDWDTGDLAVRDLATGQNRRLTDKGRWEESEDFALYSRWSPDGTRLAYDWYRAGGCSDLRVLELEDGRSRLLYETDDDSCVTLHDWSPDGREVLFVLSSNAGEVVQLCAIAVRDGRLRVIRDLDRGFPWDPTTRFSPDGRYVVYTRPSGAGDLSADVFVVSSDGQKEERLVDHPAEDFAAGWSPDGRWVLFVSDRTGTLDLWIVPVTDGRASGEPRLVKSGVGRIDSLGLDSSGRFYYANLSRVRDVYTVTLDALTGRAASTPSRTIQSYTGSNEWPSYSRDGSLMAFVSSRGSMTRLRRRTDVLCVRSLESGEEREFHTGFRRLADPRFSPDQTSVFVAAWDDEGGMALHEVDTATGDFSPVVEAGEGTRFYGHAVAPDGAALFYARCDDSEETCQILRRDLVSRSDAEIYGGPKEPPAFALAPDGRTLTFTTRPREPDSERIVRVVPATGGTPREVYRFPHVGQHWISLAYSADGESLFIPRKLTPLADPYWTVFRVPVNGGEPRDLGLKMVFFDKITAHPGGERIAFSSGGLEQKDGEVWVIEDFLPATTARR
jgi:Tol biopolymer transport system component